MTKTIRRFIPAFTFSILLGVAGCGEVEERIDCRDICTDYEACAGDEFDVMDCVDQCEDEPHSQIDDCDACLDSDGVECGECIPYCAPLAI